MKRKKNFNQKAHRISFIKIGVLLLIICVVFAAILVSKTPKDSKIASNISLPGAHNLENGMAASAACRALGLSRAEIERGLKSFKGVPHRIELVRLLRGVRYVNDSKATNVDSTLVALKSFSSPILLILGGEHKGTPYKPLIPFIRNRVKTIFTIGEAAKIIEKDLASVAPIISAKNLKTAVQKANEMAESGEVVLLSPACASFDQFKNFEHRGEEFAKFVKKLS
jgi:UDP-N-acetylmuramoylalanine--D-glutamate ligase